MKNSNSKNGRIKSFIRGVSISDIAISDLSNIEIIGDRRVIVEETKNILEYESERVRLNAGKFTIAICGYDLILSNFTDNIIVIDGKIKNICLE